MRKELSIFIDESGDFGKYDYQSPFYILGFVFHDQNNNIRDNLLRLLEHIHYLGYDQQNIHIGPIIRKEDIYKNEELKVRKKLLIEMMYFIETSKVRYKNFCFEKKQYESKESLIIRIKKEITSFIIEHYTYFLGYDKVIVYYDNGQNIITKLIKEICSQYFGNFEYRKVLPKDYILFQAADLLCTFECLHQKYKEREMTRSEMLMFQNKKTFHKDYYQKISHKSL